MIEDNGNGKSFNATKHDAVLLKTSPKDFFCEIWADQLVMTTKRRIY